MAGAGAVFANAPVRWDGHTLKVAQKSPLQYVTALFGDRGLTNEAEVEPMIHAARGFSGIVSFQSPFASDRTVVALIADDAADLPALVDGMTAMTRRMDDGIVLLTRRMDGALADVGILTRSAQDAIAQINASTLPGMSVLSSSVVDASRTLTRTVRQFGQSPQSFIFGPPRAAPGPGEPGFAGFGSAAP
jgi:hypothetical protein